MESELQDVNSKPPKQPDPVHDDGPLLEPITIFASNTEELEKKFAAYVRRDVYGTMGRGELPTKEKVLLGVALVTLVPVRMVAAMALLLLYYLICRVCTLCSVPNREDEQEDYAHLVGWRRIVIVQCGKALSRVMLFILGFYWITQSCRGENPTSNEKENKQQPEETGRPGVIISNHVSYVDILYHMSKSFPSFVAKRSVAKLPLIGLISKCLGCIFVQRESKTSDFKGVSVRVLTECGNRERIRGHFGQLWIGFYGRDLRLSKYREITAACIHPPLAVVTERIREAHRNTSAPMMMLFPEGTTTNGEYLLPFKSGGFLAHAPVLPVILNYRYQRLSPAWDSISGLRHVIFLFCQFINYMEVTELPMYSPSQEEKDNPKLYANNVRRLMSTEGNLILSDIGLAEKRIYHSALNGLFSQC